MIISINLSTTSAVPIIMLQLSELSSHYRPGRSSSRALSRSLQSPRPFEFIEWGKPYTLWIGSFSALMSVHLTGRKASFISGAKDCEHRVTDERCDEKYLIDVRRPWLSRDDVLRCAQSQELWPLQVRNTGRNSAQELGAVYSASGITFFLHFVFLIRAAHTYVTVIMLRVAQRK